MENNWRHKTIERLERQNFGDPQTAPTNMVKRCWELCKVPIGEFTIEDLRLMIGQQFSLQYLVPLAIEHLRFDIFVEGDYYEGDLLNNVLSIDKEFWDQNKHHWKEINELIKESRKDLADRNISVDLFDTAS